MPDFDLIDNQERLTRLGLMRPAGSARTIYLTPVNSQGIDISSGGTYTFPSDSPVSLLAIWRSVFSMSGSDTFESKGVADFRVRTSGTLHYGFTYEHDATPTVVHTLNANASYMPAVDAYYLSDLP